MPLDIVIEFNYLKTDENISPQNTEYEIFTIIVLPLEKIICCSYLKTEKNVG